MRQEIVNLPIKYIQRFLSLALSLSWRQSRDILCKSVLFRFGNNVLVCYATDFDTYIECMINIDFQTDEEFELTFLAQDLMKLVKLGKDNLIIKIGEPIFIFLLGSWIPIEQVMVQNSRFILDDTQITNLVKIDALPFDLLPIITKSTLPQDKYVNVLEDISYSRHITSFNSCSIKSPITYQLSYRELNMLKIVQDTDIYIGKVCSDYPRMVFLSKTENCELKFSFLYVDAERITLSDLPKFSIQIQKDLLLKIFDLIGVLSTSLDTLKFRLEDNKLKVISKNRLKDLEFEIYNVSENEVLPEMNDIEIQFSIMNNIIHSFDNDKFIDMSWDDSKLYISSNFVSDISLS